MPKILVVEDNEENREILSRFLQRHGYDVVMAFDGQQGVEKSVSEKPDLILMDMNMPVLDGWGATRMIAEAHGPPVIALTAHALEGDREKALAAGCADYHLKPLDFPQLMNQIESLLKQALAADEDPLKGGEDPTTQPPAPQSPA